MRQNFEYDTSSRDEAAVKRAVAALQARFGDKVSVNQTVRQQHANITTWHPVQAPDAVLFPSSTQDVADAVKICAAERLPVIGFGVGTSLEGNVNAPFGGLCIDMGKMNEVVRVNEDDVDCVVQAGVTRKQLNDYLRSYGLFFPIDPGADATIGGMSSTRASGTNAVRYGTMRENVLALTVVMADGSIRKTGTRSRKSAAGYDMTRLFVGSEGTLGIITEVTLRLYGIPQNISAAVCSFPTLADACNTVINTVRMGLPIARIELLDEVQIKACNMHSGLSLAERPTLFLEFHGTDAGVADQIDMFKDIAAEFNGSDFEWAAKPEDRTRLWQARHDVYWACQTLRPGTKFIATDVCVPISRLGDCMVATKEDIVRNNLVGPIAAHAGDGNFHVSLMADMNNPQEMEAIEAFIDRLNRRAISMEGTCTGEHGIGQGKREFLIEEHGDNVLTMRAVKQALDPLGIMNPGKLFLD